MDEDFGKEMDELKKDRAENLKRSRRKKNIHRSKSPVKLNPNCAEYQITGFGV